MNGRFEEDEQLPLPPPPPLPPGAGELKNGFHSDYHSSNQLHNEYHSTNQQHNEYHSSKSSNQQMATPNFAQKYMLPVSKRKNPYSKCLLL